MKYILGSLALLAAIIIVGCSATTLFLTAYNAFAEPWQQWLNGAGMAAIVAWEAGAVLVIGFCFAKRHWFVGAGAIALLITAMAVTSRQELRLYVGGQADVTAKRSVASDDRKRIRAELERAYIRRDQLQSLDRPTKLQVAELAPLMARIKDLESRWDTRTEDVKAAGNAEGELAKLMFGFDADLSQAVLNTLPLWFWLLARVFSIPAVVIALGAMGAERKPQALQQANVTPEALPAVSVRPRAPLVPRQDVLALMAGSTNKAAAPTFPPILTQKGEHRSPLPTPSQRLRPLSQRLRLLTPALDLLFPLQTSSRSRMALPTRLPVE